MKIIVTGGAGFVGSNLVDKLFESGERDITIIDNLATGKKENIHPALLGSFKEMDIRFIVGNEQMFENCDVVFHLAALPRIQPSFKIPFETISTNCSGTVCVLEAARMHGCKVVYAGSSSFYGDPNINPYSHSKWLGEEHCKMYNKTYGVSAAIARFFNVYGPKHIQTGEYSTVVGIFEHQKKNKLPLTVTGDGMKRRDFTHVNDIVAGLIAMSKDKWNGEVFNLGSGHNYSIKEVAHMFEPTIIEHIPARLGEATNTLADISFTKEKLGWEPKENIENYIKDYIKKLVPDTN